MARLTVTPRGINTRPRTRDQAWAAANHRVPLNVEWPEFGAVGDGVHDDTNAIQAAINALPVTGNNFTTGGRILFTPGHTYLVTSPLVADLLRNVVLECSDARTGGARILAGGALQSSANSIISARSSIGFTIQAGLVIQNNNSAFAGRMIDLRTLPGYVNTQNTDRASLNGTIYMAQFAGSTAIGVDLQNAQSCRVDGWVTGGGYGVQGMATGADFCNTCTVSAYFQAQDVVAIRNLGFASAVNASFEPLRSGAAGAYLQDPGVPANGLTFQGIACQDVAAAAGGNWITVNGKGVSVNGGAIVANAGASTVKGIVTNGNTEGLAIRGVWFLNLAYAIDPTTGTHGRFNIGGNSYTTAPVMNGNNFGQGSNVEGVAPPYAALSFQNSFANQAGGFAPAGYWLDGNGFVHLAGYIQCPGYAANAVIAQLPVGFRPQYQLGFQPTGVAAGAASPTKVNVNTNGNISISYTGLATVELGGITFPQYQ